MNAEAPKPEIPKPQETKNNTHVNTFFSIFSKPYLLFFLFWCIFNIDVVLILLGKQEILYALKIHYNIQYNPLGGSVFPFLSIDTLWYWLYLLTWDFALPLLMTFISIFGISWFMGKLEELDSLRTTKTKLKIAKKHEEMTKIATDKAIENWLISNITIAHVKNTLTDVQNLHEEYNVVVKQVSAHLDMETLYTGDLEAKKLLNKFNVYDNFQNKADVYNKVNNTLLSKIDSYLENFLQKIPEDNFTPQQKNELLSELKRYLATHSTANPQQDLQNKDIKE